MKVLQVIGALDRGGAETLLVNILNNINRDKFKFDFLVYDDRKFDYSDEVIKLGANIIFIESPTEIGMFNFIKKLTKLVRSNQYEVVHAHTLFNCGPVVLSAFLAGVKKRFSHSHNTKILEEKISLKKKMYFFLSKLLLNLFSTKCLACGEDAGKFLFYKYKKIEIIKNGIDTNKYIYNVEFRTKIRKEYNFNEDDIIIGNIGRLNFQKNQMFLIDIFSQLKKENNAYKLIILGDGELKNDILKKVKELNLSNKDVILPGNLSNANEFYSAFDIFVFPSLFEGLPYTLIEAQCSGIPIVSSCNVSAESNISSKIDFANLDDGIDSWINKIKNIDFSKNRKSNVSCVENNGYSIGETIKKLESIYGGIK